MKFSLLDLEMNGTCDSMNSAPPHLTNVATLPCENQNNENVTLHRDITKESCIRFQMYHSFIKVDQGHHVPKIYLNGCYTAKRTWNKDWWHWRPAKMLDANLFWLWPEHHRCWRDHLRSCMHAGSGHFQHMLWHEYSLYDSPEHFMKLSM